MRALRQLASIVSLLVQAHAANAQDVSWKNLDIKDYQSFVGNWAPDDAPLCAALSSSADWEDVIHPAATMFSHTPSAPPESFWKDHAVLLVSRVIDAGPTGRVFTVTGVARTASGLTVNYSFAPTPKASSRIKWPLALQVAKPLPPSVRFVENGAVVCVVHPGAPDWIIPALGAGKP